jgi:hypothetical protein
MTDLVQHPIYKDYYGTRDGRVFSKKYKTGRVKELKPMRLNTGYYLLGLCHDNKRIQITHHKFIADIFLPNPNNYSELNHKDEDKSNNCADNLEWCSRIYNMRYSAHKFCKFGKFYLIENLKTNEVYEIQNLNKWCRENKVHRVSAYAVMKGKQKQTKGFIIRKQSHDESENYSRECP